MDTTRRPHPRRAVVRRFWDFVDSRAVFRRLVLMVTLWMTYSSYVWAASFAEHTAHTGSDAALIIAAVLAPVSFLQTAVFASYTNSRKV